MTTSQAPCWFGGSALRDIEKFFSWVLGFPRWALDKLDEHYDPSQDPGSREWYIRQHLEHSDD